MRKLLFITTICVILALTLAPQPAAAQNNDPYYVIDLVNALRAEYGLYPYTVNAALMTSAQLHSQWASGIGTHSHTGAGGSTPKERAMAAGYGNGSSVRVAENIYWGSFASADSAVEWWRNSSIHFQMMTSTNYTEIGAGVAFGDAGGFFTLNFGNVLGTAPPASSNSSSGNTGSTSSEPAPAALPVIPVELAEPAEDGSIVHTVQSGQTLWDIAVSYDVELSEILALNRLNENSVILPGYEIVVVPSPVQAQQLAEGPIVHTVETGQTLFEIALTYGVELQTIEDLNGLGVNSLIYPGEELLVKPGPDGENPIVRPALYHTVETGQTPSEIAWIYGITLDDLYALNNFVEGVLIMPGDKFLIRPGDPTPLPATEAPPEVTPEPAVAFVEVTATLRPPEVAELDIAEETTADAAVLAAGQQPADRRGLLIGVFTGIALMGATVIAFGVRTLRRQVIIEDSADTGEETW